MMDFQNKGTGRQQRNPNLQVWNVTKDMRHVLQVENENQTKNWTLVAHKKSTSSRSLSPTSQNNSPSNEKGSTGNFHDSEKRQDTSNASGDLLCSNRFDALLKTTGKQVRLTENDHDLIQEKQVSPPVLNSKLSPEAPIFMPKLLNSIDLGEKSLDENGVDLGEDSLDEDEEDNMLDICFDRVAREADISPRQQRSGSNKRKKKTYGRQHSWDGSTRSNKSKEGMNHQVSLDRFEEEDKKKILQKLGTSLGLVRPLDTG
ncbi:hypothetical protein H5410_032068 [Solanum commersonii]|uniref:NB-ARC domain containing protein n=1 Tax=Solanum commersonii TaxID=4109 RepID=A0A9J5YK01_SOLCO|nr:hypothetical protein H5410_032068 [Solanum commersonii]